LIANPKLENPALDNFSIPAESPAVDRGKIIDGFTQNYSGLAPDIGAYEGDRLVEGPPFYIRTPPDGLPYREHPRITRHRVHNSQITLFFSTDLRPESVVTHAIDLRADNQKVIITKVRMGDTKREVIIEGQTNVENKLLKLALDPLPRGENGKLVTKWASTIEMF